VTVRTLTGRGPAATGIEVCSSEGETRPAGRSPAVGEGSTARTGVRPVDELRGRSSVAPLKSSEPSRNDVRETEDVFTSEQWEVSSVAASKDPYHDGHGGSPDTEFSDYDWPR
jgi:hypothetical protein